MRRFRRGKQGQEEIIEGEIIQDSPPRSGVRGLFRRSRGEAEETGTDRAKPVERVVPDLPTPDEMGLTAYKRKSAEAKEEPDRSPGRLRHLLLWREIRPGMLFIALGLVIAGVYGTLYNLNRIPENMKNSWALALFLAALIWSAASLIVRRGSAFLAGAVMAGVSLSLFLDTQGYAAWKDTLVGVVLITVGLGIIARGLLLRQGATVTH